MLYKWTALNKDWGIKVIDAVIAAAWTTITTAADPDLVGGVIIGIVEEWDSNAIVKSVALGATWTVTVTTASAQTAECTYNVAVARATGNDA